MGNKTREEYVADILARHAEEQRKTELAIKDLNAIPDGLLNLHYKWTIHNEGRIIACFSAHSAEEALAVLDVNKPLPLCLVHEDYTRFLPDMLVEDLRTTCKARNIGFDSIPLADPVLVEFRRGRAYGQSSKLEAWFMNDDNEPFVAWVDLDVHPIRLDMQTDELRGHLKRYPKYTWPMSYPRVTLADGTVMADGYKQRWPNVIKFREGTEDDSGSHVAYSAERTVSDGTPKG